VHVKKHLLFFKKYFKENNAFLSRTFMPPLELKNPREYIDWLSLNKSKVPHADRLITILQRDPKIGHLYHAESIKRFVEGGKFTVTDIEEKDKGFDVDIQLNGYINLQVWLGASVSTHNIEKGKVSSLGGVETDWDKDLQKVETKLNQLPETGVGLLICYDYKFGIVLLPEWTDKIPPNKALAELQAVDYGSGPQGESILYCSGRFNHLQLAKEVLLALGYPVKAPTVFE
jgi:hypothetical protein